MVEDSGREKKYFGFGLCGNFSAWNLGSNGLGYLCSFRSKLIDIHK